MEQKPVRLQIGKDRWQNIHQLEKNFYGVVEKLNVHGYEDRAQRLLHLKKVLKGRLSEEVMTDFRYSDIMIWNSYKFIHFFRRGCMGTF